MDQRILLVVVVLALISISAGVPVEGQGSDNELRDSLLNLLVRRELAQQQRNVPVEGALSKAKALEMAQKKAFQSDNDYLKNINKLLQHQFGKK